ncbi:MAG: tetratricopeptide repeat protein [Desulfobacterales bacterium]
MTEENTEKTVDEYIQEQRFAIMSNPECSNSHYNLATALMGLRRFNEAEEEFKEAIRCSPNFAEAYVQLGGICLQRGDIDGCLAYNQQSVKVRAAFAEGYGNIGFVQLQKGNVDEAIAALEKAVKFNSRFIQAYATLANAYLFAGQVDKSIETGLKVLEIDENFAVAHNNLAIAYLEKGDFDKAAYYCSRARELGYEVAPEIVREIEEQGLRA